MRQRAHHSTPAHAPAWVRARHWPALAGVAGVAAVVVAAGSLQGHPYVAKRVAESVGATSHSASSAQSAADYSTYTTDSGATAYGSASPALLAGQPSLSASATPGADNGGVAPADPATISGLTASGIPVTALDAYESAADHENLVDPGCQIPWPLLAGIGRVESNHGRFGGAVLLADGTSTKRIIGIALDGSSSATITDTDHGRLDGDPVYDHAVGPMQFIPSTWAIYGADGNGDGKKDPFNIFDAAAAAAHYLCVAGGTLSTLAGQTRAVLAYNHSAAYLALVLNLERAYAAGVPGLVVPVLPPQDVPTDASTTPVPTPSGTGSHKPLPPVDPGPPLGAPPVTHPHPHPSSSASSRPGSTHPHPSGATSSSSSKPSGPTQSSSTPSSPDSPSSGGSSSDPSTSDSPPSTPDSPTCTPDSSSGSDPTSDSPTDVPSNTPQFAGANGVSANDVTANDDSPSTDSGSSTSPADLPTC